MSGLAKYRFEFDAAEVGTLCEGLRAYLADGGERAPAQQLLERVMAEFQGQQPARARATAGEA